MENLTYISYISLGTCLCCLNLVTPCLKSMIKLLDILRSQRSFSIKTRRARKKFLAITTIVSNSYKLIPYCLHDKHQMALIKENENDSHLSIMKRKLKTSFLTSPASTSNEAIPRTELSLRATAVNRRIHIW